MSNTVSLFLALSIQWSPFYNLWLTTRTFMTVKWMNPKPLPLPKARYLSNWGGIPHLVGLFSMSTCCCIHSYWQISSCVDPNGSCYLVSTCNVCCCFACIEFLLIKIQLKKQKSQSFHLTIFVTMTKWPSECCACVLYLPSEFHGMSVWSSHSSRWLTFQQTCTRYQEEARQNIARQPTWPLVYLTCRCRVKLFFLQAGWPHLVSVARGLPSQKVKWNSHTEQQRSARTFLPCLTHSCCFSLVFISPCSSSSRCRFRHSFLSLTRKRNTAALGRKKKKMHTWKDEMVKSIRCTFEHK